MTLELMEKTNLPATFRFKALNLNEIILI